MKNYFRNHVHIQTKGKYGRIRKKKEKKDSSPIPVIRGKVGRKATNFSVS